MGVLKVVGVDCVKLFEEQGECTNGRSLGRDRQRSSSLPRDSDSSFPETFWCLSAQVPAPKMRTLYLGTGTRRLRLLERGRLQLKADCRWILWSS